MSSQNKGILLVEALLSILILSVAITASVRSITYSVKAHHTTREYYNALQLLKNKMSELESVPELKEGIQEGFFEKPYRSFSWFIQIEPLDQPGNLEKKESSLNFFKIHAIVYFGKDHQRSISINTILSKDNYESTEDEEKELHRSDLH